MSEDHGRVAAFGFGTGYLLTGAALLLQEAGVLTMRWSFVLPAILLAVGFALLASALLGAHRTTRTPSG